MVLPGYALMSQGVQVHIAAWPGREPETAPTHTQIWPRQLLLSRAFASQAGCYVIAVGGIRQPEHTPEKYRELSQNYNSGDSYIIDPRGEIIAGPARGETILTAEVTLEAVFEAKAACDIGAHYSRPDIFQLLINDGKYSRVTYDGHKSEPVDEAHRPGDLKSKITEGTASQTKGDRKSLRKTRS